jgi:putative transposase
LWLVKAVLPLDMRVFGCEGCGLVIDRDMNAARNLARLVENGLIAASSAEIRNACGEGSAHLPIGLVRLPPMKQERSTSGI